MDYAALVEPSDVLPQPQTCLIRIPEVFAGMETAILDRLEARPVRRLGREFHLVRLARPDSIRRSEVAGFIRWNLPVHHAWPCNPRETEGFVEKAAQALFRKFSPCRPQTLLAGSLDPTSANRYYRTLASNLRGRALQLFSPGSHAAADAESQDSRAATLFCLVGKEGLFCGLQSPLDSNGFYPGGTRYISQSGPRSISRAGAKIAEALHHALLHRLVPPEGAAWLELGASPGGMTSELLARGYRVTAVDRAPLDARLAGAPGLVAVQADAAHYRPAADARFDAMLSDMNGDARDSMACLARFTPHLRQGGLVVFTLKLPGVTDLDEALARESAVVESAARAGLDLLARTHLSYNRHELTLFFRKA